MVHEIARSLDLVSFSRFLRTVERAAISKLELLLGNELSPDRFSSVL